MNGDGRLDIVSGCYSARGQGMVAPVWALYRTEAGDFAEAVALKTDAGEHVVARDMEGNTVTERICTEPFAFDWDADGDLDLIIGNFDGAFLLVKNVGTAKAPRFKGKPEYLENAAGKRLLVRGHHGAPFLVDWDGDGDVDLISGCGAGGAQIAENTPTEDGSHRFSDFRPLLDLEYSPPTGLCPASTPITPAASWRLCVADYNADGKLDLIVGDCLRRSHPAAGLSIDEARAKQGAWSTKRRKLRDAYRGLREQLEAETEETAKGEVAAQLEEIQDELKAQYEERAEFIESLATGHVWVYLRK